MTSGDFRHVHFIGIGGVGMSGIALIAHTQGICVSGSDTKVSHYTQELEDAGIAVHIGHDAHNIPAETELVVVSTAIAHDNPEYREACRRELPLWHRAQMLAYLGRDLQTLAITGTHGKTTTSSMVASVLDGLGLDPTFLIGGTVAAYKTNAHAGSGSYYVIEADESDKSFTHLRPFAVLVTNIEADHLDHYRDLDEIYEKFATFMKSVPEEDGFLVVCGDDEPLAQLAATTQRHVYTYGFSEHCDTRIVSCDTHGATSHFQLVLPDGQQLDGKLCHNPGRHNVENAAGVLTLVWALGFDSAKAADMLAHFGGVRRRFDVVGTVAGVTVVDDYAHHPTEIAATIQAASELGFRKIHVLFQPHRYSRAKLFAELFHDEFGSAFDAADNVVFIDVFSAGETPLPGVSGQTFLQVVLEHEGHPSAVFEPDRDRALSCLLADVEAGDLVITMGAGDVTAMAPRIVDALAQADVAQADAQEH